MPGDIPLHVDQMDGFVQPPVGPPPITVYDMIAAAEAASTEQAAPVAASELES